MIYNRSLTSFNFGYLVGYRRVVARCLVLAALLVLVLVAGGRPAATVLAQGGGSVTGIQEYFIPGTQEQMLDMFNDILQRGVGSSSCVSDDTGVCVTTSMPNWSDLIESRVSIVAYADRSVVLIDRASNGYLPPGDYNPADYDGIYNLDRGQVIVLDQLGSDQLVGGDRIVSVGGPIFVVRAGWPQYIGSGYVGSAQGGQILAGYWELYPTAIWGTEYGSPMGENGDPVYHVDDLTTKVVVQAKEDATVVSRNSSPVTTLNRGHSYVIDNINVGDEITGDEPIAVSLVASGHKSIDMRFFNLTPPALLDHEYVLPLSSMNHVSPGDFRFDLVRLYIYAYDPTSYTIFQGGAAIASGLLNDGGLAVHNISLPTTYSEGAILEDGLRIVADDGARLQVLAAVDSNSAGWDWGFPVVGSRHLVDEYYLAWSPATGPGTSLSIGWPYLDLGHPVFVSPVENNTTIQVDWDNDDTADETVTLDSGQWIGLLDRSDNDNTGAHVTGSGPFAIAWGEDLLADTMDGFDLGYSILPQPPEFFEFPLLELDKEVLPDKVQPGEFFNVVLALTAPHPQFDIENVAITDKLPTADFVYTAGSAVVHYPGGIDLSLEPTISGQDLTWDLKDPADPVQEYTLPTGETVIITFRVDVVKPYSGSLPDTQVNNAEGFGQWSSFEFQPTDFDFMEVDECTAITLAYFTAQTEADHVALTWETKTEIENAGFYLHRAIALNGPYTRLNDTLIPAEGDPLSGASYAYTDAGLVKGKTYYYKLEDVDIYGVSTFHGPASATPLFIRQVFGVYLPLILK